VALALAHVDVGVDEDEDGEVHGRSAMAGLTMAAATTNVARMAASAVTVKRSGKVLA